MIPAAEVFAALHATWPPARTLHGGGFTIREGLGGGNRVSCATADAVQRTPDIDAAEELMRALGQRPLFMIRGGEDALDARLAGRGYEIKDPTLLLAARVAELPRGAPDARWPPEPDQIALWASSGIDGNRIAVMERVKGPKAALRGRDGAATAFVARHDDQVMLHALEVAPDRRRCGLGREIVAAAAGWADDAAWLTLAVTRANAPARAFYEALGMQEVGRYHYRVRTPAA